MPWTEEDDKIIESGTKPKRPRSVLGRLVDSFVEGALHNPIGAEGVVRATSSLSSEELNRRERILSDRYAKRRQDDEEFFKDVDTFSPANIGKHAVDLIGNIVGGADPTYVLAPGKSILQRMGAQGAINSGVNAASQVTEKRRGVRDEINPDEIALSGAGGVVLQGAGEVAGRAKANRQLARGGDFSLEGAKEIGNKFGTVTSTVRSPARNKKVGGVKNSYHLSGRAIDIARGKGVTHKQLERAYRRAGFDIIESLDEGDHSHFAFRFGKKTRTPEQQARIKERGQAMARMNAEELDAQFTKDQEELGGLFREVEDIINQANDSIDSLENIQFDLNNLKARKEAGEIPLYDFGEELKKLKARQNKLEGIDDSDVTNLGDVSTQRALNRNIESLKIFDDKTQQMHALAQQGKFPLSIEDVDINIKLMSPEKVGHLPPEARARAAELKQQWEDIKFRMNPDPVAAFAPPLDSFHEKFTPYVDTDNLRADNDTSNFSNTSDPELDDLLRRGEDIRKARDEIGNKARSGEATHEEFMAEFDRLDALEMQRAKDIEKLRLQRGMPSREDVLTPAERQEMDASAVRPDVPPTTPKGLGKGSVATTPVNDLSVDRNTPPPTPREPPMDNDGYSSGGPFSDGPTPPKDPYEGLDPEQKLIKAIKAARPVTSEQRKLAHAALSEKAKKLNRLQQQGGGMDSLRKQMKAMKGKIPEADYESIAKHFTEDDIRTLLDRINFSNSLMPFEKVNTQQALLKLLGAEGLKVPTQSELRNLSEIFSNDLVGALLNNRTLMQKFWHGVKSGLNLPRALMASFDLSAPFRQGVFLVGRKEFYKSFWNMFKLVGSENASKALVAEIKGRPNYQLMKEAGLAITDPHSHFLMDREEDFMSDWAESKIAKKLLVGHGVAASNRAYSGFLNKLRADVFDDFVKKYEALGVDLKKDPKKLKDIAKFVNAATGRGSLGMNGNRAAPFLNNLFFSPRLIASRVQMLNPVFYAKLDPVVRKEAVKQLLIFSGLATSVLTMASQAGLDVEVDPRSTDFGKIKAGNTRFDILGGFQQYIRLGAQVISGEAKTLKGDVKELKPGFGKETRYSKLLDFLRSKYSPVAAYAANALDGENVVGEEFDAIKNGYESFIPLFIQGLMDNIEEHGSVEGTLMSVPSLFGVGVQTFEPKEPKGEKEKTIEDEFKDKTPKDLDKELGFN